MIFTPEQGRRTRPGLWSVLAGSALALAVPGQAAPARDAAELIARARGNLASGDGIAAEIHLRQALAKGAMREEVAAFMGEALLDQDEPEQARDWLGSGMFAPDTAAQGFRSLARLERLAGDLEAAGRAFDRAIALTPKDAAMWVEIGRLRYAGGEHALALEAADHALKLDPENIRALEFQGQIVRDQYGLVPALPWFEAALARAPDDIPVLGEYAATLGDLGRTREMLAVTRRMIAIDPHNARAFYLQAVLAARAGKTRLARSLLNRTGDKLKDLPGAMLLEGILEIRSGNYVLAGDALERLVRLQPDNAAAQVLLARTMFLAGDYRELTARFSELAQRPGASPYLLTVMGRAHEILGQRDLAAPLLDRAAFGHGTRLSAVPESSRIGVLLAAGQFAEAEAAAEQMRAANPGSYDSQTQAGDVQLVMGRAEAALDRYRLAARIRMPENLMLRVTAAYVLSGQQAEAGRLVEEYLRNNPMNREAARLAARLAAETGDWKRARFLLENLKADGGGRDAELLSELSLAQLRTGDAKAAAETGEQAYRLQRANPAAALAWGLSLATLGQNRETAAALLDKACRIMGDHPLVAEGRRRLGAVRKG